MGKFYSYKFYDSSARLLYAAKNAAQHAEIAAYYALYQKIFVSQNKKFQ